jgi:hypothetical protein
MRKRIGGSGIGVVFVLAACSGPKVDLGGQQLANGGSDNDASAEDAPTSTACTSLVDVAACADPGRCSDGSGYLFDLPTLSCSTVAGPPRSFTSTTEVAKAMVGVWHTCASNSEASDFFGGYASGIEFTDDGHFFLLTGDDSVPQDATLVREIDAPPPLFPSGPPSDTGTYAVVDASATLGPGMYQSRLTASSGGTDIKQVIVFDSPPRLRFFSPGASDYVRALTKEYQANVCGPGLGPRYTPSSSDDLLTHMQGRWARCSNSLSNGLLAPITAQGQGVEFPGNGTWYTLVEDDTGKLVRATDAKSSGTIQGLAGATFSFLFSTAAGSEELEPLVDQCGALTFAQGADAGGLLSYEYRRLP